MPVVDGEDKVVGIVLKERRDSGNYHRCYLVLDFSTHKLKTYTEEAEYTSNLGDFAPEEEINCQYITKVGPASSRPKTLNCFEIGTPTGTHFFAVDSAEEREDWVESIRKSSIRQGSAKQVVSSLQQKQKKDVSYQTKVVAGVVHRTPIQSSDVGTDLQTAQGGASVSSAVRGSGRRGKCIPRIIKAGHAIKMGAVMKNWKRRFFVLTEASLAYYKTVEELEPIRTISIEEITRVQPNKDKDAGKEHMFDVVTPSRTFYVQTETEEDMQDWVRVFQDLLRSPDQPTSVRPVRSDSDVDSDEELGTLV